MVELLQNIGLQIRREPNWMALFKRHGIEQVIDVGANHGQFHKRMRRAGFAGKVISFEPNSSLCSDLKGGNWYVHNAAVSDFNGVCLMDVSGDDAGGHLMSATSTNHGVNIRSGRTPVSVVRLDEMNLAKVPTFLKTDAEGHDLRAIQGAGDFLKHVPLILSEVALERRYQHEPVIGDVIPEMRLLGFRPALFDRCAYDGIRGVETAVDVLWVRI